MATVLSTLYPPLIDTFMPAFPYNESAKVEFSISPYNSTNSIKYLHVSLVNQKTNQNAFEGSMRALNTIESEISGTYLVNGIWIIPFNDTNDKNSILYHDDQTNLWHLSIPPVLLKAQNQSQGKTFTIDYYYKLQLRFDECPTFSNPDASYLTTNRVYFSEWSSICLLKAIPKISCFLKNFDSSIVQTANINNGLDPNENSASIPQYTSGSINLSGYLTFHDSNMSINTSNHGEYLKSYIVQVLNSNGDILEESPIQYTSSSVDKNSFSYLLDVHNQKKYPVSATYTINLIFTTNNNYTFTKTYYFQIIDYIFFDNFDSLQWNFETRSTDPFFQYTTGSGYNDKQIITKEDGIIKFNVTCGDMPPGYLYIRRESSIDEFQTSELICCKEFLGGNQSDEDDDGSSDLQKISCSIVDDTVGSLTTYKYSAQYQTLNNRWTNLKYSQEIYVDFYDILIKRGSQQLAIRYNAQIGSMTPVKTRVKIDTLGGRYPKFAENANLNYKQFTINGLITAESDFNRTFLDEFGKNTSDYHLRKELQRYDDNMDGKYMIRNDTIVEPESNDYGTYSQWILESDTYTKKRIRDLKVGKKTNDDNSLNTDSMTRHDIYPWENWWWERYFREAVIEWLNDGEPKLWRSMTEGNMIVMFDGISLTPNAQLGRRTWNLSATVYEVGDGYKLNSLDALGIYSIKNDYEENIISGTTEQVAETNYQIGQLYQVQGTAEGLSIRDIILKNLQMNYTGLNSNYQIDSDSIILSNVKVQFCKDEVQGSMPQWYDLNSYAAANGNINITIYINGSDSGGTSSNHISWANLLKQNNVQIQNEGELVTLSSTDILLEYLKGWETEIINGNALVKIEFLEKSQYRDKKTYTETLNVAPGTEVSALANNIYSLIEKEEMKNYGLGYKLIVEIPSGGIIPLTRTIFVNEHGYYQIPSNVNIQNLYLYDNQIATIDYLVQWDTTYNDLKDASGFEIGEDIVGQISGIWQADTNIGSLIEQKYYYYGISSNILTSYVGVIQQLEYWKATDFEVTPYTTFSINQAESNLGAQNIVVGRTGTLRLSSDFPITSCILLGRKMFKTTIDRQSYLDEWEFVLDSSIDNPVSSIENPNYNTVYGIIDEKGDFKYKLYYIDGGWYDIVFDDDETKDTLIAKVPINGIINYKGNLIKNIYT